MELHKISSRDTEIGYSTDEEIVQPPEKPKALPIKLCSRIKKLIKINQKNMQKKTKLYTKWKENLYIKRSQWLKEFRQ